MAVIVLPMDGGYKPRGNLAFEPYQVRQKRLGLPDVRNKGALSLIPEVENAAHKVRMAAYWKAIRAEEEAKKVHTCAEWDYSSDEDSPSEWCPACRHAAWLRHSRASQKALVTAYLADKYPKPQPSVLNSAAQSERQVPFTIQVTPLQKAMIEGGGPIGLMMRDSLCKANMRPFWYYAELEDKDWLTRKMPARVAEPTMSKEHYMAVLEKLHGPVKVKAPREQGYVPASVDYSAAQSERQKEPAFFRRAAAPAAAAPAAQVAALSGDETKREAAFAAWSAKDRRRGRQPYFRGRAIAGSCMAQEHRVILKNLPLEVASLKADMWELVAQVAPVVDLWAPKGIVISLANAADVDTVLNHFSNGLEYYGSVVRFERMGARTK
jgi:hypothetical protein